MWMADSDRYSKMRNILESMQKNSESCVIDLVECLEKLLFSMTNQADLFLSTSMNLTSQSRNAIREERKTVLAHLDAVQKECEELNINQMHLLAHIKKLQDDRRGLQLRMEQMVPRSEMSAAQQEAGARADDLRSLEKETARQREVIEGLNGRLSEMENEKSALLSKIQVRAALCPQQRCICSGIMHRASRARICLCAEADELLLCGGAQGMVPRGELLETRCVPLLPALVGRQA
jgi:hypothetical protein